MGNAIHNVLNMSKGSPNHTSRLTSPLFRLEDEASVSCDGIKFYFIVICTRHVLDSYRMIM